MNRAIEHVDLVVEIVDETASAILVRADDRAEAVWLPRSQIEIHEGDPLPGMASIVVPAWLAENRGLA